MSSLKHFIFAALFIGVTLTASASIVDFSMSRLSGSENPLDEITILEVIINNSSKIKLENVPSTGYLEVYSILGVKVKSVNLKTIIGSYPLDLAKGVYILKAGKIAQKIIVR